MTRGERNGQLVIGIIGAGTIGRTIAEHIAHLRRDDLRVGWICTRDVAKARDWAADTPVLGTIEEALGQPVDLVVEAAVPDVMRRAAPLFLARTDMMAFTLTPLADSTFYDRLQAVAETAGTRLLIPKGAIIAIDGIRAAQSILTSVRMTTIKSPASMGLPEDRAGVVASGSTRSVTGQFPRNTNVHVAVALAGLGLDATQSVIIAEPGLTTMRHVIEVEGQGLNWKIEVESRSLGGVSGAFVPLSAAMSVLVRAGSPPGICFE